MSTNKLIDAKFKTLFSFYQLVVIATSMSLILLTGCQTTTGMQNDRPNNDQPGRSSTVIPPKSAMVTKQVPEQNQQQPIANNQNYPAYPPNQRPHRDAHTPDMTALPNIKASPVSETESVANTGNGQHSSAKASVKVEDTYGVIFPTDSASPDDIKREHGHRTPDSAIEQVAKHTSPEPISSTTVPVAPEESADRVDARVGDSVRHNEAAKPVIPTAIPNTVTIRLPEPDQESVQQTLLNQARKHSNTRPTQTTAIATGDDIPAFKRLMNAGVQQLRQGKLSDAQGTFTRAQRLAPQSSAVYFYLAQVALKKREYLKAEAMARRGLVVTQTASSKKALWQVILKSAQHQGNQRVIEEAQSALLH